MAASLREPTDAGAHRRLDDVERKRSVARVGTGHHAHRQDTDRTQSDTNRAVAQLWQPVDVRRASLALSSQPAISASANLVRGTLVTDTLADDIDRPPAPPEQQVLRTPSTPILLRRNSQSADSTPPTKSV